MEDVKNILSGRQVDFLFIDGLHTYEGVKSDFEMYSNLVRNGGIIAFHDIVPYPEYGINKFWNEIKNNYKNFEIVKDRNQDLGFGIGIIYK